MNKRSFIWNLLLTSTSILLPKLASSENIWEEPDSSGTIKSHATLNKKIQVKKQICDSNSIQCSTIACIAAVLAYKNHPISQQKLIDRLNGNENINQFIENLCAEFFFDDNGERFALNIDIENKDPDFLFMKTGGDDPMIIFIFNFPYILTQITITNYSNNSKFISGKVIDPRDPAREIAIKDYSWGSINTNLSVTVF